MAEAEAKAPEAGRLVQVGTIPELQARPATKFVEALLADRG